MSYLLYLSLFIGCRNEPTVKKAAQSKRIHVKLGNASADKIKPVQLSDLEAEFSQFATLDQAKKETLSAALNLVHSACPIHIKNKTTIANALVAKKEQCQGLLYQWRAGHYLAAEGRSAKEIIKSITVTDVYLDRFEDKTTSTIALFYKPTDKALKPSLKVLLELKNANIQFYPLAIDESGFSNRLLSLNNQALPLTDKAIAPETLQNSPSISITQEVITENLALSNVAEFRSTPTWFVNGFRLRGLQSSTQIQRLVELSTMGRRKWD